jgi:carbon monoxide dehydrogenase subunit G
MDFKGSETIKAPRSLVWKCLNDPDVLKNCVPGCQAFTKGEGGIAGFGKMNAEVALSDEGEDTVLSYVAYAEVGGKLAQIGTRLVSSVANKLAATFFQRFNENVSALAAQQ